MNRNVLGAVLMAALLVLAGCSSGLGPIADDGATTEPDGPGSGLGGAGQTGTVNFYISDEQNAIDDFAHLNVTITKIGLHRVDGAGTATATSNATGTASPTATGTATPTTAGTATPTATGTPMTATGTATASPTEGDENAANGNGEWVEYEVNATADLTELKGANATTLDVLEAPAGDYDKVFIYVSEIDGTLNDGKQVNVKLPSSKLHINKGFTVGNGENVSFVFDLSVHKAGKSGKYILKPVVSQSGTGEEVDIEDVDREKDERDEQDEKDEKGEQGEQGDAKLSAEFVGPVEPGKAATVKVTGENGPVANATVEVDGEVVGRTGQDGTITFDVPQEAEELTVTITTGDAEVELEREFEKKEGDNP